ncbi:1,2-phenylacetyl-CoA epoxidase subunit PaaC [Salinibaculum salinum]|uniref:1,2-phenylacetyl-CoA epoxidase subunit PaaC n=1 Tax=Salinibaculum salinum TaxID=3131996 RepID=UPI0030EF015D
MTVTAITDIGAEPTDEFEQGLARALLEAADDDHVMGNRLSDWTGVAPTVEEDVSISNIAQDELGHAEILYEEVADIVGSSLDHLAYQRAPDEYRNVQLVEREFSDWADTVVRQYFYDAADDIRLAAILGGDLPERDESLAGYLQKVDEEEDFHAEHGDVWLETLADEDDGSEKIQRAIDENWVDALAFFETTPGGVDPVEAGVYEQSLAEQRQEFVETVTDTLTAYGYDVPETDVEDIGAGRAGKHTDDHEALLAETREVREQGIDVPA